MDKIEIGEVFSISDEDGQEDDVEVLAITTIEGTEYIAVGFVDEIQAESDEEIDIFFLRVEQDNDFGAIESDEEFEKVSKAFDEILNVEA